MLGNRERAARAAWTSIETWIVDGDDHVSARMFTPAADARTAGVVIVPSIVHEDRATSIALAALAGELAGRGLPTTVIDLAGTAQGPGSLDTPELVDRWIRDVRVAVRNLRERGVDHVAVVGVRVGALVAATALVGDPVDEFVAWAPVLSGRRFVREMKVLHSAATEAVGDAAAAPGVTVAGFTLPPSLIAELSALDLARLDGKPASVVTLVDSAARLEGIDDEHPLVAEVPSQRIVAPQTEEWLFTPSDSFSGPFDDIARLVDHVDMSLPATLLPDDPDDAAPSTCSRTTPSRTFLHDGALVRETFVAFGAPDGGELHGVLSEPADRALEPVGYVGVTSVGPGRLFVDLARREAARGRATLRFDLAGFGTSARRPGRPWADYYDPRAHLDVSAAVDELRTRGVARVALVGYCAGAAAAIDVAPRDDVTAIAAVNFDFAIRGSLLYRQPWPDLSRRDALVARIVGDRRVSRVAQKAERSNPVPSRSLRRLRRHLGRGTRVMLAWEACDGSLGLYRSRFRQAYLTRRGGELPDVRVYEGLGHLPCGPVRDRMLDHLHDAVG